MLSVVLLVYGCEAWSITFFKMPNDPVLSLFPPVSLPNVMCDHTDLIWRKRTPFEAMTGRTAPS